MICLEDFENGDTAEKSCGDIKEKTKVMSEK